MSTGILAVSAPEESGFDIISLLGEASGPGLIVLLLLAIASVLVWIIWLVKWMQLTRLKTAQRKFERACHEAGHGHEILDLGEPRRRQRLELLEQGLLGLGVHGVIL